MELSENQLAQLKEVELNILKAVIRACEELRVKYYLLGGTLLGAVRHQGFIPWDDDIDIGMLRPDYEIFKKKAQEILPRGYFLQTRETDPEYPHNFMKIRDSETTFIETSLRQFPINHGVYIDLFPLDYYPEAALERSLFDIRQQLMKLRLRDAVCIPEEARHGKKEEAVLAVAAKLSRAFYPSLGRMQDAKEKLYQKTKSGSYIGNFSGAWGKREIVPAGWYGDGCMLEFEGLPVRAPSEYEKWLTQVYGDYRKLPPKEKRAAHHYNEVVDLDCPYTAYTIRSADGHCGGSGNELETGGACQ